MSNDRSRYADKMNGVETSSKTNNDRYSNVIDRWFRRCCGIYWTWLKNARSDHRTPRRVFALYKYGRAFAAKSRVVDTDVSSSWRTNAAVPVRVLLENVCVKKKFIISV